MATKKTRKYEDERFTIRKNWMLNIREWSYDGGWADERTVKNLSLTFQETADAARDTVGAYVKGNDRNALIKEWTEKGKTGTDVYVYLSFINEDGEKIDLDGCWVSEWLRKQKSNIKKTAI